MNFIWDNLYDRYKDRRYGVLFVFTMLALVGLPMAATFMVSGIDEALRAFDLEDYFLDALPGLGLLAVAWGILLFQRAQARKRDKLRRAPLSRDELRVARSKLRNGMKPMRRPATRTPDTFLKY